MPDLLVVVLDVGAVHLTAALADVDHPGEVVREVTGVRSDDLASSAAVVLERLGAGDLGARLLALAVAVGDEVPQHEAQELLDALGDELGDGWGLPAALPVVPGRAADWAAEGARAGTGRTVAGAVLAAARSTGAHAHLPRARPADGSGG